MAAARDLRVDFFRGLALVIVVIDHVEVWGGVSVVEAFTLAELGFSDAAEIFVFLSGYVFVSAYARALDSGGLPLCLRKACRRSFEIYVAYVLASLVVIGVGAWVMGDGAPPYLMPDSSGIRVGDSVGPSIVAALALRFHPFGFAILAMYVPMLPAMACLLYLRRRVAWLPWLVSGGLYAVVQVVPALNFSRYGDGAVWFFNPFAWQFLFFIGMVLGDSSRRRVAVPRLLADGLALAMLLAGLFVLKVSVAMVHRSPALLDTFEPMYQIYWTWAAKTPLAPLRVLHFLALVYLTSRVLPGDMAFWGTRWARPLVVAGQHSLELYAFGLVVTFLGAYAILGGWNSTLQVVALDGAAVLGTIAFGFVVHQWRRRGRKVRVEPAVAIARSRAAPRQPRRRPTRKARNS